MTRIASRPVSAMCCFLSFYPYPVMLPLSSFVTNHQITAPRPHVLRNAVLVREADPPPLRRHTSAAQKGTDEPDRGPTGPATSQMPIYVGHHLLEHCATSQAAPLDAGKYKDGAGFSTTLAQQHGSWDVFAICPTWRATSLHGPQASVLLKTPPRCMTRSSRTTWRRGRWTSSPPPLKLVARPTGTRSSVTTHTAFHGLSLTLCLPSLVHAGQCTGSSRKAKGSHPCQRPLLNASEGLPGGVPVCTGTLVHPP